MARAGAASACTGHDQPDSGRDDTDGEGGCANPQQGDEPVRLLRVPAHDGEEEARRHQDRGIHSTAELLRQCWHAFGAGQDLDHQAEDHEYAGMGVPGPKERLLQIIGRWVSSVHAKQPLLADNDVVLNDRQTDPHEQVNLANNPAHHELVSDLSTRLEALIDAEIGSDTRARVPERPRLVGWPTWRGDAA